MDPFLPTARALAVAGDRIVGGVGVHEQALPSPERVDLGGRCVLPGFSDAHVHFPTWAMTLRQVQLDGCASLGEASSACAPRSPRSLPAAGSWATAGATRLGDGRVPAAHRSRPVLGRPADRPLVKGLPLALAQLGRARPRRRRPRRPRRGRGARRRRVSRRGSCARKRRGSSATGTSRSRNRSTSRRLGRRSGSRTRAA